MGRGGQENTISLVLVSVYVQVSGLKFVRTSEKKWLSAQVPLRREGAPFQGKGVGVEPEQL